METQASPSEDAGQIERAHTISRKSARIAPIELITRGERRRRWTVEQKQMIAAQSLAPGASATEVARLHGIGTGQLYNWRKALLAAQPGAAVPGRFARVEVVTAKPLLCSAPDSVSAVPTALPKQVQPANLIEIVLPAGTTLRVDAQVDPCALRRILAAVRG
jgi:transposase